MNRSSVDAPGFAAWDDGRERVKPLQRREVYAAVAEVELARDALIVHVRGMDRLWALRSRLEIPLAHVLSAEADPELARGWWRGIRSGGTQLPGVITAGTFHQEGERVFWDVHEPEKTVVIRLKDERYSRLVIGVEDPATTVAALRERLEE